MPLHHPAPQLARRAAVGAITVNFMLLAYKKYVEASSVRKEEKGDGRHSTSATNKILRREYLLPILSDGIAVWGAVSVIAVLYQQLIRTFTKTSAATKVAVHVIFGVTCSLTLQKFDRNKLRQGLLGGLCINSALESLYLNIFSKRERAGQLFIKAVMAVAGAQLSHAFILTPYAMSKSDLRFFRLASGHTVRTHAKVVAVTKGSMQHASRQQRDLVQSATESTDETFCALVHPNEKDCMDALIPSVKRALKMAFVLYTPFLMLQLAKPALSGRLTSTKVKGAVTAYLKMVCFLTTFSGLVQWLPCFFCRLINGFVSQVRDVKRDRKVLKRHSTLCRHDTRWLYAISGFTSAGVSSLWDSSSKMRNITLVLLPRAIQSAILDPSTQRTFMQQLAAAALGIYFALHSRNAVVKGGILNYVVRSLRDGL